MEATRLVCVGDSFTEGMCDDLRADGHYVGWADRVAAALAHQASGTGDTLTYANLAVRGKLLDQVVREQVPVAVSFAPTIVTFHAGPNDVLRRGTDLADLGRRYENAVRDVAATGPRVVLFTSISRAGGTGRVARLLAARFGRFNDGVRAVGQRHGATIVDLERVHALSDRRLWNEDRLHLNREGHARVAAAVLDALGVDDPQSPAGHSDWWQQPLPPKPPTTWTQDLGADVAWVRGHLAPWIGRRLRGTSSGDGRSAKDPALRVVD